jgi:hypothetical protein
MLWLSTAVLLFCNYSISDTLYKHRLGKSHVDTNHAYLWPDVSTKYRAVNR